MKNNEQIDTRMYDLLCDLFPFNRSITGNGVRETLERLSLEITLQWTHIESGTVVFDWIVPNEWNVNSAKIYSPNGDILVDFDNNNLFLMGYSIATKKTLSLQELKEHIITDQKRPEWIPYSTSYYQNNWAFCMPYNMLKELVDGDYRVEIDSTKEPGELIYAEAYIDNMFF